ncbi:hypothetical protein BT93_L5761 [Corymbia citriodora subsp. variegata]|uniref:Uncharacterized protein n=1 Tax=Corymbia citriodora subsp. variegata TaxID=360336 RepID=A0A8T0CTU3_CORYI|nr:hypothetical protein BT93_L5761 [Corymbia citriodora subsp. variegata]
MGSFLTKASSSLGFLWCNWKFCISTNVYLVWHISSLYATVEEPLPSYIY